MIRLDSLDDSIRVRLRAVRLVSLDVDGVLTDGRIYYGTGLVEANPANQTDAKQLEPLEFEAVAFHAHDGHAIVQLQRAGIEVVCVSGRKGSISKAGVVVTRSAVLNRTEDLGIKHTYTGIHDKAAKIQEIATELNVPIEHTAHVGDDEVDLLAFEAVGLAVAVPNAVPKVKEAADIVLSVAGGKGAVREFADLLLEAKSG